MVLIAMVCITRYFNFVKENQVFTASIESTIPGMNKTQEHTENETTKTYIEKILSTQLAMSDNLVQEKVQPLIENSEQPQEIIEDEPEEIISPEIAQNVTTQVIEENNIKTSYTNEYQGVQIKNSSKYNLTEEMLTPNIELSNTKDILIFHTHTCESYTPTEAFNYTMTGNYRTTDLNYSVARVGKELKSFLEQRGFSVRQDTTYNDYPAYSGSYNRSLEAVQAQLNQQGCDIVIDLHRDAVGSNSNYAPTVRIGEEYAAQLMFVIGTDGGGLKHPNWQQNLKFAVKVQQKANELYPGLFRPIIVRNSRYNQHTASAACIVEVGATGNTLEQCITSMKYLAQALDEVV